MPHHDPYAAIHVAAAMRAGNAPSLDTGPRADPVNTAPSAASERVRNVRVAAATIAAIAFRGIAAQRGDYPAIIGRPLVPGGFSTKRGA